MGAVKNAFHDEICNRCPECGVGLSEYDTVPCDSPLCPIPGEFFQSEAKTIAAEQAAGDER